MSLSEYRTLNILRSRQPLFELSFTALFMFLLQTAVGVGQAASPREPTPSIPQVPEPVQRVGGGDERVIQTTDGQDIDR